MKVLKPSDFGLNCRPSHVRGSSMTIPNLAPSIFQILHDISIGLPVQRVGTAIYDDSLQRGNARLDAESVFIGDLYASKVNGDFDKKPSPKASAVSEKSTDPTTSEAEQNEKEVQ